MSKVRYGIVGVGHLGTFHVKLAKKIPEINLIGIFDINADQCSQVAESYQVKAFTRLKDLLAEIEAVSIVVPTTEHFKIAQQALGHDCHLFVEKPITSRVGQARKLLALARRKGKKIQVGHIERFNPALLALKDYQLSPLFIEGHRLSRFNPRGTDVSVILDLMIHDLDIVLHLIKSRVTNIHACGVGVVSEVEDIANVRLEFANKSVVNLTASRISAKDMRKMRIFQKNAYIAIDFLKKKTEIFRMSETQISPLPGEVISIGKLGQPHNNKEVVLEIPEIPGINSLQRELQDFALSILKDTVPPIQGEDGLRALELAEEIIQRLKRPEQTFLVNS